MLYLFSPFLSKGLRALSRNEWSKLIVIMLVAWCILPTLLSLSNEKNDTEVFLFYNRFIWMVVLFTIGGFLRLYTPKSENPRLRAKHFALATLASFAILLIVIL